jgi:hypothetical protein
MTIASVVIVLLVSIYFAWSQPNNKNATTQLNFDKFRHIEDIGEPNNHENGLNPARILNKDLKMQITASDHGGAGILNLVRNHYLKFNLIIRVQYSITRFPRYIHT